jgi:subtilisin family serine protease
MAMGEGTFVANGYSDWDEDYYNANGTSLSTPVLAGAVACLRQARPYSSVQDVCDVIRACSDRADNPDNHYGYGIPDFSQALEMLSVEEPIGNTPSHIISVYPNPASDEVHVALNDAHKAALTIYDVMGRVMFTYSFNGLNHTTLENYLNSLNTGVYFINAVSESGTETLKLVIAK